MSRVPVKIILYGATGRICRIQHLERALLPIRQDGGVQADEKRIVPELLLVGRDAERLEAVAERYAIANWTTDLDAALADESCAVFFDAAVPGGRAERLSRAIRAGKHVYAEKPLAETVEDATLLLTRAREAGVKHGVVEDKLSLPGMRKLSTLKELGFFGTITSFQLTYGYWVFSGDGVPCQRSSWNYRRETGGGQIRDMYPHWRYLVEGVLGRIERVVSMSWTGTPTRVAENGERYDVDVEDSCATLVALNDGVRGVIVSSGAMRVRRDDLLTLQVDGSHGSAVAGLHRCRIQPLAATPRVQWNPDVDLRPDYDEDWMEAPTLSPQQSGFRTGWENFLRHVAADEPMTSDFRAGVRDVQLATACHRSVEDGAWVPLPSIT